MVSQTPGDLPTFPCTLIRDGRLRAQHKVAASLPAHVTFDADDTIEYGEFLLENGFVPNGNGTFAREECPSCGVCVPMRVPLDLFVENGEHKRILRRNEDLQVIHAQGIPNLRLNHKGNVFIKLLNDYTHWRFPSKTTPPETFSPTAHLNTYKDVGGMMPEHICVTDPHTNALVGVIIYNVGRKAAYGSVFFYEPALRERSIGHFLMLQSIRHLRRDHPGIKHYYLAKWSTVETDFSWKAKYLPAEMLLHGEWTKPLDLQAIRYMRTSAQAFPARRVFTPSS